MSVPWSHYTVAARDTAPDGGRIGDGRFVARVLAALLTAGAGLGSINLLVDGVLRPGVGRTAYGATMALLLALAALLCLRGRVGPRTVFALVLAGDLVYVVVALSITDPVLYAPPLMLLFPAFTAAWFLDRWQLGVHLLLVPVACWLALGPSFDDPMALAVQVAVNAGILDVSSLGVFVLRRRVQRLLAATQRLSSTDPLTGLANRRTLVDTADRLWRQAGRDGQRVAALVVDLDRFKDLNDEHGHAAGDAVLQAVARALAGTVRPSDVLARTGGEEMVVVGLVRDPHEARHLAERLLGAVRESGHPRYPVTASIGVALTGPQPGDDARAELWRLIDRADLAMYQAKQSGRDRLELAGPPVPLPRMRGRNTAAGAG